MITLEILRSPPCRDQGLTRRDLPLGHHEGSLWQTVVITTDHPFKNLRTSEPVNHLDLVY